MAEQVEHWQRNHRGARSPLITARPAVGRAPAGTVHEPPTDAKCAGTNAHRVVQT